MSNVQINLQINLQFNFQEELKKIPPKPGVYIMKDEQGHIIYVGKAVNLKNRVRSYFRTSYDPKVRHMVPKIAQFEYIITDNEVEALILECNLIKEHNPKYNVLLKDDKAYPYIKLTQELLPRIVYAHQRDIKKVKSNNIQNNNIQSNNIQNNNTQSKNSKVSKSHKPLKYFGPYPSGDRVREILRLIHDIWPLRRCFRRFPRDFGRDRPCLQYHIGQCKAPCHSHISQEEYDLMIEEAVSFLQGKVEPVTEKVKSEMMACSENLEFERAAELRDLLNSITMLTEKQKAENTDHNDRDVIAVAKKDNEALVQVFFVRDGKITGREHFMMSGIGHGFDLDLGLDQNSEQDSDQELDDSSVQDSDISSDNNSDNEIFAAFIKQFYTEAAFIPKELVLAKKPEDQGIIEDWLSQLKGQKVRITVPQKGEKLKLVQLAARNADLTMEHFSGHLKRERDRNRLSLQELADALELESQPDRIEAYDISNIQGFESVGSMVVFEEGKAKNSDYRKFKIKSVHGPDDYASMEEIITRRFKRLLAESEEPGRGKFSKKPDLLMIDGGKGQVHAAEEVLKKMGLSIPVCGMVKDDRHRTRGLIYKNNEITMARTSEGFKFITRIQDEVHRFALEYHRKLRADSQVRSILDDIPGIGPTRRKDLMRHFKGLDPIRKATVEELAQVINKKSAEAVYNFFRQ